MKRKATLGFEQLGNQSNAPHNPSGSANPKNSNSKP